MKIYIFYTLFFLQISCATIVRPTGGPTDTTAPSLKKTNKHANKINNTVISLNYNENIIIKDPYLIYTSPKVKLNSSVKLKQLTLSAEFDSNYNNLITLNKAIADINENNVADSSYYIIANKPKDTSFISGSLLNYMTRKPSAHYLCQLQYIIKSDTTVFQTFTDTNGYFAINYLPNNIKFSLLHCYNDKNKNYEFDIDESFAFVLNPTTDSMYSLLTLAADKSKQKSLLKYASINNQQFYLVTKDYDQPIISQTHYSIENDSLTTFRVADTLFITLNNKNIEATKKYYLYNYDKLSDSLNINFSSKDYPKLSVRPPLLTLSPNDSLTLISSTPIKTLDDSKIRMSSNSETVKYSANCVNAYTIQLNYTGTHNLIKVFFDSGAITDIFLNQNKSDSINIKIDNIKNYGQLEIITDSNNFKPIFIKLFEKNQEIPKYSFYSYHPKFTSSYILSGTYDILIVQDDDRNKNISGPIPFQKHAETSFYKKDVTIIATFTTSLIIKN